MFVMLITSFCSATLAEVQFYNVDPTNPAVMLLPNVSTTEFKATRDNGPWNKKGKNDIPTVVLIPSCGSEKQGLKIVSMLAETLPTFLSKESFIIALPKQSTDKFLESSGFSACPKQDQLQKVFSHALSLYDIAVALVYQQNGWVQIVSYHATSNTEAKYHGFQVLCDDNPSAKEAECKVVSKHIIDSINLLLDREKK
jgi:hypothetical protein